MKGAVPYFLAFEIIPDSIKFSHSYCDWFRKWKPFVQVFMTPGAPMPPIATNWLRHHHPIVDGWQLSYAARIEQFRANIGNDVAMQESVNLDID
ncbi:hypothetical protein AAC387_Pa08g1072 [Persea americana]